MVEDRSDLLANVSDTALWVAVYRAEESERPDALFHDPYARRLAGERGFALLDSMRKGRKYGWPMVLRTVIFDRFIEKCIAAGADLVVNLAAGLDARPYRMELPSTLTWIEVDLAEIIDYKSKVLAEETSACRLERISLDLADEEARRALFQELAGRGSKALVLSEGLLIYLEREQVEGLARDLAAAPAFRWWVIDLASPGLRKMMTRTWGAAMDRAQAPFRFAPEEGPAFFPPLGWRPVEIGNPFREAARTKRLPWFLRPLALLPDPKRWNPKRVWGGDLLLEHVEAPDSP